MPRLSAETHAQRKRDLLGAATVILARAPQSSMAEIAEHARVGRATLYRYFPTREALMRAICLEALDRTDAACAHVADAPTAAGQLKAMLAAIVPLGAEFHFLYTEAATLRDVEIDMRFARQLEYTRAMFAAGQARGEIDPALPIPWLVRLLDGAIWAAWYALAYDDLPAERIVELSFRSLWPGMRSPQDQGERG